jgi:hypothetical protein
MYAFFALTISDKRAAWGETSPSTVAYVTQATCAQSGTFARDHSVAGPVNAGFTRTTETIASKIRTADVISTSVKIAGTQSAAAAAARFSLALSLTLLLTRP